MPDITTTRFNAERALENPCPTTGQNTYADWLLGLPPTPFTGGPTLGAMCSSDCLKAMAENSARWMAKERDLLRQSVGARPLTDSEKIRWRFGKEALRMPDGSLWTHIGIYRSAKPGSEATGSKDPFTPHPAGPMAAYPGDLRGSCLQFATDIRNITHQPPKPLELVYSAPDGIAPYDPDRISQTILAGGLKALRAQDVSVVEALLRGGAPIQTVEEISRQLSTAPIADIVLESALEHLTAGGTFSPTLVPRTIVHTDDPNLSLAGQLGIGITHTVTAPATVPGAVNLPGGPANTPTNYQAAAILAAQALHRTTPSTYTRNLAGQTALSVQTRDLNFWKRNHGKIVIDPRKNPSVPRLALTTPWTATTANPRPPLVTVTFIAAKRPLPERGGFLPNIPGLSIIIGLVPIVGTVVNLANSFVAAGRAGKSVQLPESMFEPQYYPRPQDFLLPLNQAQLLVGHPEYINKVIPAFYAKLTAVQQQAVAAAYASGRLRP